MQLEDFGRYLSQQRELRGLSREDVSKVTRIPLALIGALESGQADRLPERVFVINYVRAYAQVIGLAAEDAVLRFEEIDKAAPVPSPAVLERRRRKKALTKLLIVIGCTAAAAYVALTVLGLAPVPGRPW